MLETAMRKNSPFHFCRLLVLGCAVAIPPAMFAQDAVKPIKALLITGGCCHDYAKQKDILKQGLEARANLKVDIIYVADGSTSPKLPILGNPDYAKGYDVVIHDECGADINNEALVEAVKEDSMKDESVSSLVTAENADRAELYRLLAAQQRVTPEVVAERNALRNFQQSGDTRLIFDLRGNPGGYLDQAVQMASYFLPVGDTIVTEDFEGKQDNIVNRSLGYNVFANKKLSMAILIDQGSASASEIFSGALQQHGVAKLVGTRSFGKGSVQQVMDLGNGAELKVTIARWLTPNGNSIMGNGLMPDIAASSTTVDNVKNGQDPTMDAAASWLMTQ